jgi:predicted nucleic acid-binding protein
VGDTLVDSNVILDILTIDPKWSDWSKNALEKASTVGNLAIDPIIYAEISTGYETIEKLESALAILDFLRLDIPWEAGFLAGKNFMRYKRQKGLRRSPLPDFYIGAHAAVRGLTLLTRDPSRYRTYFPNLEIFTPE